MCNQLDLEYDNRGKMACSHWKGEFKKTYLEELNRLRFL